jgi:hypothetical protein
VALAGEDNGENQSGDLLGSNAWGLPGTQGGAGHAATTVSGGGEQLGRVVERRGKARRGQRGRVSGGRGAGAACGAQRGGAGQLRLGTWPARAAGAAQREAERGESWRLKIGINP